MAAASDEKLSNEIVTVITNYDFSENADKLKAEFAKYFHTFMIDAQSPNKPNFADIVIENTYYPGLWNASVEFALRHGFKWLMFVASDLQISNVKLLCERASVAVRNESIGIYTASLRKKSRSSWVNLYRRPFRVSIRECGLVEGFFFLARVEILAKIFPIPHSNKFGWGMDVLSCYISYTHNRIVVVDDGVEIFHPSRLSKHDINDFLANEEAKKLLGEDVFRWAMEKKRMPSELGEGPAYWQILRNVILRNARCPCGSGARYKHCHGRCEKCQKRILYRTFAFLKRRCQPLHSSGS
jgi:hypothetical protein